jgi:FkbM family methyltransferase
MCQFLTSLRQIANSESVATIDGLRRHLHWQVRRVLNDFPCDLVLSHSRLRVHRPGGVAALVNAMGEYDYNNMRFVRALLQRFHGVFVDVGANIGAYTLIASEVENARVIAIEPHPETYAHLTENMHLNKRRNVTCLNVAASSKDADLYLTDESEPALNRIVQGRDGARGALRVEARRLEAICRSMAKIPDVIKIDVEGHEREVLDGLGDFRQSAKAILIEGGERDAIREWMASAGYAGPLFVHFSQRMISPERQPRPEDPVFIQQELLSELEIANSDFRNFHFTDLLDSRRSEEARSTGAWL